MLSKMEEHLRNYPDKFKIERGSERVKSTGEIFTPTILVQNILNQISKDILLDCNRKILDPSCGDGQFLSETLIIRINDGIEFEQALSTLYGVDLMQDNVDLCRERLLCGREDLRHIVENNIVCADSLRYHFRFDGSHPYDDEKYQSQDLFKLLDGQTPINS